MSGTKADSYDEEFDEGLNSEEAIEFLKLVEQARAEASTPEGDTLESPPDIPKPRKRFKLKSKGKKKEPKQASEARPVEPPLGKRAIDSEFRLAPDVVARSKARSKSKREPEKGGERPESPQRKSRWLELLLASAVVASLWHLASPTTPYPQPVDTHTPIATPKIAQPDTAAVYFLRALYTERHDEAYAFLSSDKRKELTREGFRQLAGQFLEENREALTRVEIHSIETDGPNAFLAVKTREQENQWSVNLVRRDDFWFVHSVDGGSLKL